MRAPRSLPTHRVPIGTAQLQTDLTLALHTLPELTDNLKKVLDYVRRLEAAALYYADPTTWDDDGVARHQGTLEEDKGQIARTALLRHVNLFPLFLATAFFLL